MFGLFYKLLGILCTTLEKALEDALFRVESSANIVRLIDQDSQVTMQQHHVRCLLSATGCEAQNTKLQAASK